ncbi:hypothetical protein OZZ08_06530 [Malaciobacter mytili]|uniref:hypothetical protein n=1 Tax=Malaciobacter mytili TaxID=603050 RepID=UPI003BB0FB24
MLYNSKFLFIIAIFFILLFNYIFLIINNGMYWDDWVLVFENIEHIVKVFQQTGGNGFVGYLHYFMIHILGIWSYKLFTFVLIIISGICLYKILQNIEKLTDIDRISISIFFMIYPLFHTKAFLINFPYTLMSTLFFLAFYFMTKYINNKKHYINYILALIFLYFSFFVQSILVFCFIIFMYIVYIEKIQGSKTIIYILKKNILFLSAPFIFFIIKSLYFKPYGLYSGYNQININYIIHKLMLTFNVSYIKFWKYENFYFIIAIIFLISIVYFIKNKTINFTLFLKNTNKYITLLILGISIFLLATFPYIAVNKIPQLLSMNDRLQVLFPLPFALITYSLISIISIYQKKIIIFSVVIVIIIFTYFNNRQYLYLLQDSIYQDAFMLNVKENNKIYSNSIFIMRDNSTKLNIHSRRKGAYEYAGQLRKVFGDDKRFIIEKDFFLENNKSLDYVKHIFENKEYAHYNYSNVKFGEPTHFIDLQVIKELTLIEILSLSILRYNNENLYNESVHKLIKLNVERIKNNDTINCNNTI